MKKIFFLTLAIIPLLLHAQEISYTNGKCVSGNCQNGNGTYVFDNGDKYSGSFSSGKPNGHGRYDYTNANAYYDGLWKNGQREDNNALYVSESYKYEGGYKNDIQNGKASIMFTKGNRAGDSFVGEIVDNKFRKGTYTYSQQHSNRKQYDGEYTSNNNKFNGYGVLTYKNSSTDRGLWKDDVFLGEEIGRYENKPVYKKSDSIIVNANNKKYLLSKQTLMGSGDEVYGFIPANAFIIAKDIQGGEMPIGYITTTTEKPNSTLYGENERFAESAVECKFTELICDKATYDKFIRFCDWQICKMINSANNFMIISNDLESKKEEYAELYAIIASQKGKDIAVNITMDAGDFLWNNKYAKKLKAGSVGSILGQNVSMNTSANEYASLLITDALTYPLSSDELKIGGFSFKDIKDCILQSNIINVKEGNLTLGELMKDGYRTEQTKKIEKELETEVAKYFKQGRDVIDKCIPTDLKFKSKQVYLFYAVGKNLVEYGEMLGFMAASIKLTFFDNGSKKEYDVFIDNCRKKKVLLEEYKAKYYNLIEKNKNDCLEYTKAINQLRSEVFNPFGDKNNQEILTLMQDYVFGIKEIPKCKVLSFEELRPIIKNTQLQSESQSGNEKTFSIPKRNH
jgi:hypothetical protein